LGQARRAWPEPVNGMSFAPWEMDR